MTDFDMMGLAPVLAKALKAGQFNTATPIQAQAIPLAMDGHDILGLAQTGTGKTLAFGLPLIQAMLGEGQQPVGKTPRALILAPTRELVNQIGENLEQFTKRTSVRVVKVVGGQPIFKQINALKAGVDLLVATPGRLIDLMERRSVHLDEVGFLVLDEADQMLDMGFIHALRRIAPELAEDRQTMLFSATMSKQMEEISQAFLTNPKRIEVARPGKAADKIAQSIHFIEKEDKGEKLRDLLTEHGEQPVLVFARTKFGAERMSKQLVRDGFKAVSVHGDKNQSQRDRAIREFKSGKAHVLVATDVAARGIDIPGVDLVINYDLPNQADNYIHRIGRTARAGASGEAVSFCAVDEAEYLYEIQKLMKMDIPVASGDIPLALIEKKFITPKRRPRGGGGGRRGAPARRGAGRPKGQFAQSREAGRDSRSDKRDDQQRADHRGDRRDNHRDNHRDENRRDKRTDSRADQRGPDQRRGGHKNAAYDRRDRDSSYDNSSGRKADRQERQHRSDKPKRSFGDKDRRGDEKRGADKFRSDKPRSERSKSDWRTAEGRDRSDRRDRSERSDRPERSGRFEKHGRSGQRDDRKFGGKSGNVARGKFGKSADRSDDSNRRDLADKQGRKTAKAGDKSFDKRSAKPFGKSFDKTGGKAGGKPKGNRADQGGRPAKFAGKRHSGGNAPMRRRSA